MTNHDADGGLGAYFGSEVRRLRGGMGWTRDELAGRLGWSPALLASIARGRRRPQDGFGERCDEVFGLPDILTKPAAKVRADTTPYGDLKELEPRAIDLRIYDGRFIPGLLQTLDYARELIRAIDDPSADVLNRETEERMTRQSILHADQPPRLHVVIGEEALLRGVGSPEVMRAQLLALAEPPRGVTVQVLPIAGGAHAAVAGPLTLLRFSDEPDAVFADGWTRGQLIERPAEVARAQRAFDLVAAVALPPKASAEMIRACAEERWNPSERLAHEQLQRRRSVAVRRGAAWPHGRCTG